MPLPLPLPKGTQHATLSSASCVSTRYCVAVGMAEGASAAFGELGSLNILKTWNGAEWTLHTITTMIGKTTAVEHFDPGL